MRSGDIAVLCARNSTAASWLKILSDAGLNATLLKEYDGTTSDAVKVGTYQRSKGLEFARVFLPDFDHAVAPRGISEAHETYLERAELERRQLFVAMTRARDGLGLGTRRPLPR